MANLTTIKVKIFQELNKRKIPWKNSRFVINGNEYEQLGSGGFSEVYVMEDAKDPSIEYAVKIIGFSTDRRIHQEDSRSYQREAIIQHGLAERCKAVVKMIDSGIVSIKLDGNGNIEDVRADDYGIERQGWLVLVLIKMEKLSPIIEKPLIGDPHVLIPALERFDDKEILSLALNIAEALETAHGNTIMHRDVKLENIFYDEKDHIYKLGDFGIARITNQGSASTKGAGTELYIAPEVEGRYDSKYSYQADIYSFGVTIYLLMNELRFPGSSGYYVNPNIKYNPDAIIEEPKNGSAELKRYICSLLKFYPSDRPKTMTEVVEHLDAIYVSRYGERVSSKIEKKPRKEALEAGALSSGIKKVVSNVRQIEGSLKDKDIAGGIAAGGKKQSVAKADVDIRDITEKRTLTAIEGVVNSHKYDPKRGIVKGIMGILSIMLGLTYFSVLSDDSLHFLKTPMVLWSLIGNTVISVVAYFLKFAKKEKMPYLIYFLLFCFSIYVLTTGGASWLYIVVAIGLFLGGVTEVLAISLSAWAYLLINMYFADQAGNICNSDWAWIFFALILLGVIWTVQYDEQCDLLFRLLGYPTTPFKIGAMILIAGIAIWLIDVISEITVTDLLIQMNFIYAGLTLWVLGAISVVVELWGMFKDEDKKN